MRVRILVIAGSIALAVGLLVATLALAQGPRPTAQPDGPTEAEREAAAAAALEADPGPEPAVPPLMAPWQVITAPLFAGVSDPAIGAYLIDPVSGDALPLFDRFEVWGAAYDGDNGRVFFNRGPILYSWPLDGSPTRLGTIESVTTEESLSMYGLAYGDGVLYGARGISSAGHPEGIYAIDPATRQATLAIDFAPNPASTDVGGLAADPATGALYGANDAPGALQGLVRIEPSGQFTVIAPYPEGEDDIDGLAIGDGQAYLVTDEPGSIYVFDFATLAYTTPLTTPWTTSELFAGADWIASSISLTKTVGVEPGVCAATDAIEVEMGSEVTYCYTATNTGPIPLALHDLEDSAFGALRDGLAFELAPGASTSVMHTATLTTTTVNTATWTAYNAGPSTIATASATATVTVPAAPSITLTKTVGRDPAACAAGSTLAIDPDEAVTYCYRVTNTGNVSLALHDLEDSALGSLLDGRALDLAPGASATITETATITQTTVNTATWTAYNAGPTDVVTATATASVTTERTPAILLSKTVGLVAGECAATTELTLDAPGEVTYCYRVTNTGNVTLNWHDLTDSALGSLRDGLALALAPGDSTTILETTEIAQTTTNTATWTAYNAGPVDAVSATAEATVTVLPPPTAPEIAVTPEAMEVETGPDGQVERTLTVSNSGDGELTWSIQLAPESCDAPGVLLWASAAPPSGTTAPGGLSDVTVTFDAAGLAPDTYAGFLCVASNDADEPLVAVPLTLTVLPEPPPTRKIFLPIVPGSPRNPKAP